MITTALIIDEPWVSKILRGEKVWEMRSTSCNVRGEVGLIRKGSGQVVGTAVLHDVSGPYSDNELADSIDKHHVGQELVRKPDYKWRYAWHLKGVRKLEVPVPYVHKSGAVIWVSLDDAAVRKLNSVQFEVPPKNRTMTWMRFPVNLSKRKSRYEEKAFYRRTDYWCDQRA